MGDGSEGVLVSDAAASAWGIQIFADVGQLAISDSDGEDPVILERLVRGLDLACGEADHEHPVALSDNSKGSVDVSSDLDAVSSKAITPLCPWCVPASGQSLPGMIHSMSSAASFKRASLSPRPIAAKKSFTV